MLWSGTVSTFVSDPGFCAELSRLHFRTMLASSAFKGANVAPRAQQRGVRMLAAAAADVDMEKSGLKHLPEAAREKAQDKKANKFEKVKVAKCGSQMWTEVHELSALLKEGKYTFDELNLDDVDVRLKWAGLFHRSKRAKGTFMMRLKVCNNFMLGQ